MDNSAPSISSIDVQNENEHVLDQSASSIIRYAAATTAPQFNQQSASVDMHDDRSQNNYDHQDKQTIARQNQFDLEGKNTALRRKKKNPRMNTDSFAITCWSNVPKEKLLECIIREFGQANVQYVCVANETGRKQGKPHLHVQIILKQKKEKKSWFLDKHADGDYVEFGTFRSKGTSSDPDCSSVPVSPLVDISNRSTKKITVRAQADERRKRKDEIADTLLCIAETSVSRAMEEARKILPYEFLQRSDNFYKSFNYVNKQYRQRQQLLHVKEFVWDLSFPDCTRQIHDVVSVWLRDDFRNPHRPKCLVIIGNTGTGKTSFALSLPGRVCYFKGRWCLNTWSDDARYLVFDDIPWDEFENRNFPNKKDLLSANGAVAVTDKYQPTVTINVTMPSIVLLNPGDEGSLTAIPVTEREKHQAEYWAQRAVVYRMDSNEYFYKQKDPSASSTSNATSDAQSRPLLGHDNEFIDDQRRWLAAQARRRTAVTTAAVVTGAAAVPSAAVVDDSIQQSSAMDIEDISS
ncbi:unnamed protein product [Rotaria magnacalcarata]|uniref:Geminivirus AL1 replication-associated protein central domain-containing protein n=1 Tax=Rotaria magnacalcarata TaxID=392030 RepID=A0A815GN43_9BILA|nr:unnamed protein product [Rotaria magnacalcarata]